MKNFILGQGNLGRDLYLKLQQRKEKVTVVKTHDRVMALTKGDTFWCCAGAGGPSSDMDVFIKQMRSHVILTAQLLKDAEPGVRLIFFSSHYLNEDPTGNKSYYAKSKAMLEDLAMRRSNTRVFRVGSLYGNHFPDKTFPGKIIKKLLAGENLSLPTNHVAPTPTEWLAEILLKHEQSSEPTRDVVLSGPNGSVSIEEWGRHIASAVNAHPALITSKAPDLNYPFMNKIGFVSHGETWGSLWDRYGVRLCQDIKQNADL